MKHKPGVAFQLRHGIERESNMFICSAIIYFDETPKGYDLLKEGEVFLLKPPEDGEDIAPLIRVRPQAGGWTVDGAQNDDVKEQVLKLIGLQSLISLPDTFSASP
ncbi:hypothetical protein [Flavisolibacter ginsenosidimutans]|uniref:Uncharacterized protein n=1 Tax=Flavisolibacter ginsenosidimutans TaxID=661481 RepID=A0A5B8UMX4_9BACT|nr:hypothetical protein [Flavisolibacter ginsenosidimutans]QEC57806.1 hypothetical protein FSB75_18485 [Flavisolibacter ginsenosidimutans]